MNRFLLNLYPIVSIGGAAFVSLLMYFNPVYRYDFMTQFLLVCLCMNLLVIHHIYNNLKG
jgi:hypothetical protein